MHAGGRRFDPVWLHHFLSGDMLLRIADQVHFLKKKMQGSFYATPFEDFLLFNNLENSDVLSGLAIFANSY